MKTILKNTGFILMVTFLAVVYIYNSHNAEGKLRKIASLKKEVEDAKSRYQEVKSDINYKSTESELAKMLEQKGLKRNLKVPIALETEES